MTVYRLLTQTSLEVSGFCYVVGATCVAASLGMQWALFSVVLVGFCRYS